MCLVEATGMRRGWKGEPRGGNQCEGEGVLCGGYRHAGRGVPRGGNRRPGYLLEETGTRRGVPRGGN